MTSKTHCFTGYVATNLTIDITVPTLSDPVRIMSVFDWIIIQQHLGKDFNWNLTWDEYKAGFGFIDDNFWLGLEKMHLVTKCRPYRLRVEVQQCYNMIDFYLHKELKTSQLYPDLPSSTSDAVLKAVAGDLFTRVV